MLSAAWSEATRQSGCGTVTTSTSEAPTDVGHTRIGRRRLSEAPPAMIVASKQCNGQREGDDFYQEVEVDIYIVYVCT